MKILQVIAPAAYGGLEKVVHALVGGLADRGHQVTVAMVKDPGAKLDGYVRSLTDEGARVVPIVVEGRSYSKERGRVAELCRDERPDVLHTHGYRCDVLMASVGRNARVPHVTTVHGFTGGGWKNRLYETVQRRTFRQLAGVVAVSHRLVMDLKRSGVPSSRLFLAPNAWRGKTECVDRDAARVILGTDDDRFRIGWIGRLSREKGPDILLQALAHLADLPLEVSFVGDGREMEGLKGLATELGVGGRVTFHGAIADAGTLLRAFDLFALSSRTEGTPIALLEALAARVPVIATRVGGVPDVIGPDEGVLIPPENPEALAAAIRAVVSDPESAARRAVSGERRLAAQFAMDPWIDRYESIYRQVRSTAAKSELHKV